MQRVTVTLDDDLMSELDRVIEMKGYQNRSEAIRDLARAGIREATVSVPETGNCVGALIYVYDHSARELSKRLVQTFHDHHHLSVSTLHIHLDHDNCMEINVLKGPTEEIRHSAEHVIAERGVRHGQLVLIPVEMETHSHGHGESSPHRHMHIKVK